jgi:hypothetical protein
MENQRVCFETESCEYMDNYVIKESDLNDIHNFLVSLCESGDLNIKYRVLFDTKNNHEITRTSVEELINESKSRKCSVKEMTIYYSCGKLGTKNYVNIDIRFTEYKSKIYLGIRANSPLGIQHKFEGIVNQISNKNKALRPLGVGVSSLFYLLLVAYIIFASMNTPEISDKDLLIEVAEGSFLSLWMLPALIWFVLQPVFNRLFPEKMFAIGYGQKTYETLVSVRRWLFGVLGSGLLLAFISNLLF